MTHQFKEIELDYQKEIEIMIMLQILLNFNKKNIEMLISSKPTIGYTEHKPKRKYLESMLYQL